MFVVSYRDGSKRSIHQRECLDKSSEAVGQIYPVLRDAEGRVIDGFHRLDVDPNWKSVTLEGVKTEEDRLLVSIHANMARRRITTAEKVEYINTLAQIYWEEGLRPKVKTQINGRTFYLNQITAKLEESLKGVVSRWGISKYLLPIYKNQEQSEAQKQRAKKRQNDTPAYELILNSFGKDIERSFGPSIFGRLEREMFTKAKNDLRNDAWWINKIKKELRVEIKAEIEIQIRADVLKEFGLEYSIPCETLEEISFRNLVLFYEDDLRRLQSGEKMGDVFTAKESSTLGKHGVIRSVRGKQAESVIREEAIKILVMAGLENVA